MMRIVLVLLILVSHVFGDSCVTYTFEEDYDVLFTSHTGVCSGFQPWKISSIVDADWTTDQEKQSNIFIYPQETFSCVISSDFLVSPGGVIEVNIYMDGAASTDQIQVIAMKHVPGDMDAFIGSAVNSPLEGATFVSGWHSLRITIIGRHADMTGYIAIMGMASQFSTVFVDSFRYIPPWMDESFCEIYESNSESTTKGITESTNGSTTGSSNESDIESTTKGITGGTTKGSNEITTDSTSNSIEASELTEPTIQTTTEIIVEPTTNSITTSTQPTTDATQTTTDSNIEDLLTTEAPIPSPVTDDTDDSFWTPFRIRVLVILLIILSVLTILCSVCFYCYRRNSEVSVVIVRA